MICNMALKIWGIGIVVFLGRLLACAEPISVSLSNMMCPVESISDSILGFRDSNCVFYSVESFDVAGVIEGDEVSLQTALNMVHKNSHDYVAILFYASWCLFSKAFRPKFSTMSSLYPSIPHFAVEESSIRPSIMSKYGVHGFPTLFLINSTMRVRYHGSRTLGSIVAFYIDVSGTKPVPRDTISFNQIGLQSNQEKHESNVKENCPFTWARFPVNSLRQETYLALATVFVFLRLLYYVFPILRSCALCVWRRHIRNSSSGTLWNRREAYLTRAIQVLNSAKEPCKRTRAWAAKSLATVSIGNASGRSAKDRNSH